ncbi:Hypothetical predicted protein, partial [Paramuricea clavata]
ISSAVFNGECQSRSCQSFNRRSADGLHIHEHNEQKIAHFTTVCKQRSSDSHSDSDQCRQRASEPAESETTKRTETLKQIRELFALKEMGALTDEEYNEKKENLLKYL